MTHSLRTFDEYVWMFVGCGGTLYGAMPYLAVLHRRYQPKDTLFIDPDVIEEGNYDRQWPGWLSGNSKVSIAEEGIVDPSLDTGRVTCIVDSFRADDPLLGERTDGRPVLAIVNVDNDQARLDVADWLEGRVSDGVMTVSGCEQGKGQCYPGIWLDGEAVYDWREHHPDVGQPSPTGPTCNLQNIRANALTGVLVGMCLEDLANDPCPDSVNEFYWGTQEGNVHMWASSAMCREGVAS